MKKALGWIAGGVIGTALVAGCASMYTPPTAEETQAVVRASFRARGIAKLDRLEQSELQKACSDVGMTGKDLAPALREKLEKAALASVKYPADGRYLGDWKAGERVAQTGVGMQFSDNEKTVNGGNCYACHQLSKAEISFGNIGPSLYQYGKLRGNGEPTLRYTWAKIWNAHSSRACSSMPRFGDAGVLTEAQIRDVMALLLDPASPVNSQ
jgi:sulfur-oxidizing protein SoxX